MDKSLVKMTTSCSCPKGLIKVYEISLQFSTPERSLTMPKIPKRACGPAPSIDDFIRCHGGRELIQCKEAAVILDVAPPTISAMLNDGRLYGAPSGKVMLRSIHAYLWPSTTALRVVK